MSTSNTPSAPPGAAEAAVVPTEPGPPYPPHTAQLGGVPSIIPDIPISAVLLVLFWAGAATNMTIFQRNRRRSYRFLFSFLVFGFCMGRVVALALRIAWATRRDNVRLALAAQIFTSAGVLILFVTNLVFALRIIRAYHPFFGWSKGVTALFAALFASAVLVFATVVAVTVQSAFTPDPHARAADRRVQLFCATYLAVYAFLPVPLVTLAALVPRRTRIDKFGEGHFRTKFALLTATASLLAAGAAFRAAVAYVARPVDDPAWFHGRACYYAFNFALEIVVVYTYALSRFDRRFHIPDGSSAPGHYSCAEFGTAAGAAAAAAAASGGSAVERRGRKKRAGGIFGDAGAAPSPKEAAGRRSSSCCSGGERSGRSPSARGSLGDAPSEQGSVARDADLAWVATAMVSCGP